MPSGTQQPASTTGLRSALRRVCTPSGIITTCGWVIAAAAAIVGFTAAPMSETQAFSIPAAIVGLGLAVVGTCVMGGARHAGPGE